jgi:hypothetical protein
MAHIDCVSASDSSLVDVAVGEHTDAAADCTLGPHQLSATSGTRHTGEQDVRTQRDFEVGQVPRKSFSCGREMGTVPTGVQ